MCRKGVLEFEAILCVYPCCHFCVASVSTCFLSHMVNVERGGPERYSCYEGQILFFVENNRRVSSIMKSIIT